MKVLLVDPWGSGGITAMYSDLAKYLTSRGVIVDAFCYMAAWPDAELLEPHCRDMYLAPLSLTEVVVGKDYDIVHLSTDALLPPLSAPRQLRRAGFSGGVIVTAHHRPGDRLFPLDRVDKLVAVSPGTARCLTDLGADDVVVIANGVDLDRFGAFGPSDSSIDIEKPILGWVGRSDDLRTKDVAGFLYVAAAFLDERYDFWIVDGGLEPSEAVKKLPDWFGERVRCIRRLHRSQLPGFYRTVAKSGGAIVLTSTQEACPLVLLEAWASGCPTIVPKAPGFEDAEAYGASLLYERNNGIRRVRDLVLQLRDSTIREAIVKRAVAAVEERFNLDRMGEAYLDLYTKETCIRSTRRRGGYRRVLPRLWASAYRHRRNALAIQMRLRASFGEAYD